MTPWRFGSSCCQKCVRHSLSPALILAKRSMTRSCAIYKQGLHKMKNAHREMCAFKKPNPHPTRFRQGCAPRIANSLQAHLQEEI